jgi:hypothetical protein
MASCDMSIAGRCSVDGWNVLITVLEPEKTLELPPDVEFLPDSCINDSTTSELLGLASGGACKLCPS